jgi:hypothetical protein
MMDDKDDRDNQRAPISATPRRDSIADNIIPFRKKWNAKAEETRRRLDREWKIILWSSKMYEEGRMPPDVAKAFDEHFGGEEDPEFPAL